MSMKTDPFGPMTAAVQNASVSTEGATRALKGFSDVYHDLMNWAMMPPSVQALFLPFLQKPG